MPAVMSLTQKLRCLEVMDKLASHATFACFFRPIDPIADQCPDYARLIKHPIDLQQIRESLEADAYDTVSDWKADVKLVSINANKMQGFDPLWTIAADHLGKTFKSITKTLTNDEVSDWHEELRETTEHWQTLLAAIPPLLPKPSLRGPALEVEEEEARETSDEMLSDEENELINAVNSLRDPKSIKKVVALLASLEPKLAGKRDLDISLPELSPATRKALWNLIAELS
jgi:hypothetical protein